MSNKMPMVAPVYLTNQEPLPPGLTEADRPQLAEAAKYGRWVQMGMESCAFKCAMSGAAGFGLGGFFALLSASFAIDDPLRRSNLYQAQQQQLAAANAAKGLSPAAGGITAPASAIAAKAMGGGGSNAPATVAGNAGGAAAAAAASSATASAEATLLELTTAQQTKLYFKETGKNMWRSAKGFGKVGALYSGIECCVEGYRAKNDLQNPIIAGFFAGSILARNSGPSAMIGGGVAFAAFSGAIDLYFRKEKPDEP